MNTIILLFFIFYLFQFSSACVNVTFVTKIANSVKQKLIDHVHLTSDPHFRDTFAQHWTKEQVDKIVQIQPDDLQQLISPFPISSTLVFIEHHHVHICVDVHVWRKIIDVDYKQERFSRWPRKWNDLVLAIYGFPFEKPITKQQYKMKREPPRTLHRRNVVKASSFLYFATPPYLISQFYGLEYPQLKSNTSIAVVEYNSMNGLPVSFSPNDILPFLNLTFPVSILSTLSPTTIPPVTLIGPNNPTNLQNPEGSLDVQGVIGMNPYYSRLTYWQSSDQGFYGSFFNIYHSNHNIDIVSLSWGDIENSGTFCGIECSNPGVYGPISNSNYFEFTDTILLMLASIGVTVIVASGDLGANLNGVCNSGNNQLLDVSFPATNPYVLSVGSTQIEYPHYTTGTTNPNAPYCGMSPSQFQSQGLITSNFNQFGGFACFIVENGDVPIETPVSISQSGFTSGGGFSTHYPTPFYQQWSNLIPRYLNDYSHSSVHFPLVNIHFNSSNRVFPDVVVFGEPTYLILNDSFINLFGGTSLSAPLMASFIGSLNEISRQYNRNRTLGFVAPLLYYMSLNSPNLFHTFDTGDNVCPYNIPSCTSQNGPCYGYDSVPSFNPVSGLGSPNLVSMKTWLINYFQSGNNGTNFDFSSSSSTIVASSSSSSFLPPPIPDASSSPNILTGTVIIIIVVIAGVALLIGVIALYLYNQTSSASSQIIQNRANRRRRH